MSHNPHPKCPDMNPVEIRILDALLRIETSLAEVRERLVEVETAGKVVVSQNEDHETRIRALEEHKARAVVVFGALSMVGGLVATALVRVLVG